MADFISQNLVRDCSLTVRGFAALSYGYCRIFQNLGVLSPNPLPDTGPAIVVCNHISGLDPLLIQSACRRVIVWMMAKEYYDIKGLNWAFKQIDAIPVARSGRDSSAIRTAFRALDAGRVLGIFPEGKIEPPGKKELLPFQTGVAQMAIRAQAPIIPAYLEGTNRGKDMITCFKTRNHVRLRFGPLLKLEQTSTDRDSLEAATTTIQRAVERLRQLEHTPCP